MAIRMLTPWKNPRSENLWFRRRVPPKLVPFMGRKEIKFSLGTSDPKLAQIRVHEENVKLERMWHDHINGQTATILSQRQIEALAGEFYREMVEAHRDNPGRAREWEAMLRRDADRRKMPVRGMLLGVHLRLAFHSEVRAFLDRRHLHLSGDTLESFVMAYLAAKEQAARHLMKTAGGDYRADPDADRFPEAEFITNGGKVPAFEMFESYANEAGIAAKTRRSWKSRLTALMVFVGHDDLARLTTKDIINWKDDLRKPRADGSQLDAKTVRNGYIGAIKTMLSFAVEQQALKINVAKGVIVRGKKKKKNREKGFTHEEALAILKATLVPPPRALSPEYAAARRWVPWICAYTGARVNEITQLLPSHLLTIKGFKVLRIEAEASKMGEYRHVPIHDDLVNQGLLDYIKSRGNNALFYDPSRSRGGVDAGRHFRKTGERLAEWVRSDAVGVIDEDVAPNHGWRHRFSSMARHVGMHIDVQNIIQGHAGDKVASDYGDAWVETAYQEIMKIPKYFVI